MTIGLFSPCFRQSCISLESTLREAIECLNRSGLLVSCLVDGEGRLCGILTDSDVRRAILNQVELSSAAVLVANRAPFVASYETNAVSLGELAKESGKRELPLVDADGILKDIFILGLAEQRVLGDVEYGPAPAGRMATPLNVDMFILAGGLGTRLRPVVSDRPKPLAIVGERPIIDHLLLQASRCGVRRAYVSLNYKADMIENHLGSTSYGELEVKTMREKERLGTAGSLRMMRRETNRDLLVCNADLLTTFAFDRVVHKHEKSGADITAVVRTHVHSVPYGVVDVDGERIVGMREKPEVSFLINAGIYVVKHSVLDHIADGESIDMPDLIRRVLESGGSIKPFPMHEFWLDVGKPEDFLKANEEIATLFDREAGVR